MQQNCIMLMMMKYTTLGIDHLYFFYLSVLPPEHC